MKGKKHMGTPITKMPTITAELIRRQFSTIMGKVSYGHTPHVVTNRGTPAMVLLGAEDYEGLIDMMDTMAEHLDPKFQQDLKKSHEEYKRGEVGTREDIDKILNAKM